MNNQPLNICILANKQTSEQASIGWVAAAILKNYLPSKAIKLKLIEITNSQLSSSSLASMTPNFFAHMTALGINEIELLEQCNANFNLGYLYQNWLEPEQWISNVFGDYGANINHLDFSQLLQAANQQQRPQPIDIYSLAAHLAQLKKFRHPEADKKSIFSTLDYGWNLPVLDYFSFLKHKFLVSNHSIEVVEFPNNSQPPELTSCIGESDLVLDFRLQSQNQQVEYQAVIKQAADNLDSANKIYQTDIGLISQRSSQKNIYMNMALNQANVDIEQFESRVKGLLDKQNFNRQEKIILATSANASWQIKPSWQNNTIYFGPCDAHAHYICQLELLHDCLRDLACSWPANMQAENIVGLRQYFNQVICFKRYQPVIAFENAHQSFIQPSYQPCAEVANKRQQYQQMGRIFNDSTNPYTSVPSQAWFNLFRAQGIESYGLDGRIKQVTQKELNLLQHMRLQIQQCAEEQLNIKAYIQGYIAAQR